MADEATAEEQVVDTTVPEDQVTDDALDADFDDESDALDSGTTTSSEESTTVAEEKTAEEAAAAAEKKAAEEQETEEEKVAREAAEAEKTAADEKKAEERKAAEKAEKKAATEKPQPTEAEKAASAEAAKQASDQARADFVQGMADSLKDLEIGDGGTEDAPMPKTMGEFTEQFPEIANAMNAVVSHLYDKLAGEINPLREEITTRAHMDAQNALFSELGGDDYGHTDAADIVASDEFQNWIGEQTPAYQAFIDAASTAVDIAPILARYKADNGIETKAAPAGDAAAKAKAEAAAEKQRKAKKKADELDGASTRTTQSVRKTSSSVPSDEDLDGAFDEEAEKADD